MMFFTAGLLILANARAMGGAKYESGFLHSERKEVGAIDRKLKQTSMSLYRDKLQKTKWANYAIKTTKVMLPFRLAFMEIATSLIRFGQMLSFDERGAPEPAFPSLQEYEKKNQTFEKMDFVAQSFFPLFMVPSFVFAGIHGPTQMKVLSWTAIGLCLAHLVYAIGPIYMYSLDRSKPLDPSTIPTRIFFQLWYQNHYHIVDRGTLRVIDYMIHTAFWVLHFF